MKKIIALFLTASLITSMATSTAVYAAAPFDVPVPEFSALKTDTTKAKTLTGSPKGLDLLANSYFTDIKGTYGHEAIVRMAALGVTLVHDVYQGP